MCAGRQEVADYTAQMLFGPGEPEEEAHAWEELQPYLPIPHAAIAAELAAITGVLHGLAAERLLHIDPAMC